MTVIAAARNAWVTETAALVSAKVLTADDPAELDEVIGEHRTD